MLPWIWRTRPDWGDNLIDFTLFESKVLSNTPSTIRGEIPSIRFWHLLVGMPDFTLGGGAICPSAQEAQTEQPRESGTSRYFGDADPYTGSAGRAKSTIFRSWLCVAGRILLFTAIWRTRKPPADGRDFIHRLRRMPMRALSFADVQKLINTTKNTRKRIKQLATRYALYVGMRGGYIYNTTRWTTETLCLAGPFANFCHRR